MARDEALEPDRELDLARLRAMPQKMPLEALLARSGMSAQLQRDVRCAFAERDLHRRRALMITVQADVRRYANADKRRWSLPCGIRTLDGEVKAKLDADYQLIIIDFAAAKAARAARDAAAERREQEREEKRRRLIEEQPPPAESTRTALLPPAAVEFPVAAAPPQNAARQRRAPHAGERPHRR